MNRKNEIKLSDHFTYGKLLRFTLPSIAMMIFTSIYGVVDGFFVSNFAGKTPFAAVNFIMPFVMITSTVGFMFGSGGTAIVAKTLGERDPERANRYFSLFVYFTFALGVLFAVLSIAFIRPIASLMGAEGELLENSVVYARVVLCALPFFVLQFLFQSFFVTAEKPNLGFLVTVACGVVNMALDAILVPLLPQEQKLIGAALATGISQFLGGVIPLIYFFGKNSSLLRLGRAKFEGRVLARAALNGSSEFVNSIAMSVVGMLYNVQLLKYAGENGVDAYGVMMYVSMLFSAAFIGYSVGTAPVIGFHFGAQDRGELHSLRVKSFTIIACFSVSMVILAQALAAPIGRIFVSYDRELFDLTVSGFRIFALSFLFMGFAIFGSGFFTALSDGLTSALISFLRTLVFETAAVMLLPLVLGINGIWWSIVIAELMASLLCFLFVALKKKRFGY
ncbi:MAG: MATE family efflux transporter [Clostridia bacterium]|nr:MATE family efflux transporter [Clostridia bacterium]